MSKKFFISHTMEGRQFVEGLQEILEENGITTVGEKVSFIDTLSEPIDSNKSIREIIKKQIQSSNEVVVVASDESLSSQWVNYEIGMADALDKPIIILGRKGREFQGQF